MKSNYKKYSHNLKYIYKIEETGRISLETEYKKLAKSIDEISNRINCNGFTQYKNSIWTFNSRFIKLKKNYDVSSIRKL